MIGELISAMSSVKTITDMLKTALDAKTFEAVNAVLTKMNGDLIAAQNLVLNLQVAQMTLMREDSLLKQQHADAMSEIARLVEWRDERVNYRLTEVAAGAFAYVVKPIDVQADKKAEPKYWLCCQCYDSGHKSILQFSKWQDHNHREFICQRCKAVLAVNTPSDGPVVMTAGRTSRGWDDD